MIPTRSLGMALLLALAGLTSSEADAPRRPNVVLIMTDDQGYGDLGFHGNPQIKTPRLDALARESVRFRTFYVSPVCSPTRSSLMTGRYNYRTGVVDTFRGRSMMQPDEVTIAEMLGPGGYKSGIFGKWHLGDNAPLRPIDQGFDEALVHRGGGIGQPSDPPGNSYFDPILMHNGREEKARGYCSDVFTDAAIRFIEDNASRPFFAYLAFNAPHDPFQVPDDDLKPYLGLAPYRGEPGVGHPLPEGIDPEATARVYAMVSNIDANVGRVLDRLDALKLARDTIVIFLTDNGPGLARYKAGLRDQKGSVHEGGIRVPCFVRWPGRLEPGRVVEKIAAHVDLAPTLLAACGVARPRSVAFDGRNLLPLLEGRGDNWPDRTLYFQWHRGDVPELHRAFAARSDRYKLVQPIGVEPLPLAQPIRYELFDMAADPLERADIAGANPDVVARMLEGYEGWFKDVAATRNFAYPRIQLGSKVEDPTTLTRQDWRGPETNWTPGEMGGWDVDVVEAGRFDLDLIFVQGPPGAVHFELGSTTARGETGPGSRTCRIEDVGLPKGPARLRAWIERPGGDVAVYQAMLHKRN